jgi:HK97 family phage prohead protease
MSTRTVALDDIRVRSGGDGRTVEAYAAVFGTDSEIHDQDGHYLERIDHNAFTRTLGHRGNDFRVFYNHGMTLHGTPSERGSMPIGTPLEVRADGRGLLTVTRYNRTPLADEVLEAINNGDIRGQSFTGRMIRSTPDRGPFRKRGGKLTTVTRQEIALIEYGPTPLPAYADAAILGVRAAQLADTDVMLLQLILDNLAAGDRALDPIVDALTKTDDALDQAQAVLSQILNVPDPDADAAPEMGSDGQRAGYLARLSELATRLEAVSSGTPNTGPATETDPADDGHAALKMTKRAVRARLYRKGIL